MSAHNLDVLFAPRAIALVGASHRRGSVGDVLARNLAEGGFAGPVMFVNPQGGTIQGQPAFQSVSELPEPPELAVLATPAPAIPGLISDLGTKGCRAAIVISAGFEAAGPEGMRLRQAALDAAHRHGLRIVGPNCLGVLSPGHGINASFARGAARPGPLALVAQSGAVAAAMLDWAPARGVGFSHIVTVGDSLDVDIADMLDFLADDPATKAVLLYVESIRDGGKFIRAARRAGRAKPVAVIKGGRSAAGAKAAFSHTGALAGADAVYEAAFRQAGLVQVATLEELYDAALAFAPGRAAPVERLCIVTNGGGAGVLAVDALARAGLGLGEPSADTQAALAATTPAHGSWRNPVDILGDAPPDEYGRALEVVLGAPEIDSVLVLNCPTAVADSGEAASATVEACGRAAGHKPVFTSWLGQHAVEDGRQRLAAAGIPTFETPEAAVRGLALLDEVGRNWRRAPDRSAETHAAGAAREAARPIVLAAVAEGRATLTALEADALLRTYGIATIGIASAATPFAAGEAAAKAGGPVALKIMSRDISHKSDVGGVVLGLVGREAVTRAAEAMLARVHQARPEAALDGFMIQPMASRPRAVEVLAGLVRDPVFGPVVMVGHGGVAVEVLADRALALAPFDLATARAMIGRTRVSRLLAGYRDRPAADLDALAAVLTALGRLALDIPEVAELDLNPLLCDEAGALAVDARVAVRPATPEELIPRKAAEGVRGHAEAAAMEDPHARAPNPA